MEISSFFEHVHVFSSLFFDAGSSFFLFLVLETSEKEKEKTHEQRNSINILKIMMYSEFHAVCKSSFVVCKSSPNEYRLCVSTQ